MSPIYGKKRKKIEVNASETMQEELPHWCHPGDLDFCE